MKNKPPPSGVPFVLGKYIYIYIYINLTGARSLPIWGLHKRWRSERVLKVFQSFWNQAGIIIFPFFAVFFENKNSRAAPR